MYYLGIDFDVRNLPELDPGFIPFGVWMDAFLDKATIPIRIAVERENGKISVFQSKIRENAFAEANIRYVDRLVKFLLWSVGGFRVYVCGCDTQTAELARRYSSEGIRNFDVGFMEDVYERPFEIIALEEKDFPEAQESELPIGGHLDGCRIGFDAGGSDRKVSAVIDGETVYSEEVVWFPKLSEDPTYQYILEHQHLPSRLSPRAHRHIPPL